MNSEYNFERTVDLVSFLKTVFINWRKMLILGIIFALFFGMVPVYEYKNDKSTSSASESTKEDTGKYITSEEYRNSLKELEQKLVSKKQYLINSFLMKIDPYNEINATKYIYVEMLDEENTGEADSKADSVDEDVLNQELSGDSKDQTIEKRESQIESKSEEGEKNSVSSTKVKSSISRILNDYYYFIQSRIDWTELAEKLETEPKYLSECVSIESSNDKAKITVSVKGYDEEIACEILDYVVMKMQEEKDSVIMRFSNHDLVVQDGGVITIYDSSLKTYQESCISEISLSQVRIDDFKSSRSEYVYRAPSSKKLNKEDIIVNAVAGFFGGILIVFAISTIMIFAGGKVLSAKELSLSYDLRTLAELAGESRKKVGGSVDAWIENIGLGDDKKLTEEERYRKAAQMTELYALDANTITLTGDVSEEDLIKVTENLQKHLSNIKLVYCDTLLGHTTEFKESNGVILVEKKNSSRMNEIEKDISIISEIKIPVIGIILL